MSLIPSFLVTAYGLLLAGRSEVTSDGQLNRASPS
jgi:hypothetical protein